VERLGALTTVRHQDDNIVVVGEKDEEGINLVVPLDELDKLGSWVMDRGMKILINVSTYADYSEEQSRVHLAAAKAIRSLNDRAHERYRAGDRRRHCSRSTRRTTWLRRTTRRNRIGMTG
jgi:hypothetical protein